MLAKASAIADPFEQSFFIMVQLPYLQPFDDVNKRVSRLAANIPLIKQNLIPLAFADLPAEAYIQATLGVYELNKVELLRDVYLWSYKRTADRYAAVRQSLGEPDPFRLKYRDQLRDVIREIIQGQKVRQSASLHINSFAQKNIQHDEKEKFVQTAEEDLLALHEGNFAKYKIRPSEFESWYKLWKSK